MHKQTNKQIVAVVLPTYNERDNISKLLDAILEQKFLLRNTDLHILVVDDNSPDRTAEIVEKYQISNKEIHLLKNSKKEGLGAAYIRGFAYVIENLNADILVEMDADFSHNPLDLPRLITEVLKGNDFVIGSRYIEGGSIPNDWSILRRVNSKLGNIIAQKVAGLGQIRDCTGGFRAIKTDLIKEIDLVKLGVKGYAFQISILNAALKKHAKVVEIPIHFTDRKFGQSKISVFDILEFLINTLELRFARLFNLGVILKTLTAGFFLGFLLFIAYISIGFNVNLAVLLLSLVMILQGSFTLWWMLYAWNHPESVEKNKSPRKFISPFFSFTAIVPARHEEKVIGHTIEALSRINYPEHLKEVIIVCRYDDHDTIFRVQQTIEKIGKRNVKIAVFNDSQTSKPHALNVGLNNAANDVVVVFDAEDEPNTNIYHVANTVMKENNVDVLQSGVQLMNYRSTWYSTLNVLEYFFWFKSTLHFFASSGIIPLGGNTVFFKKEKLKSVSGWDENCLTEDADIGIRLNISNARMQIVYDEEHVTREESPLNLGGFIKQRTRWNQGFLQIFQKAQWIEIKSVRAKILASYILLSPIFQTLFFMYIPFSIFIIIYFKLPIWIVMLSIIPFYILIIQLVSFNIGLYLFTRDYNYKYPLWMPFKILLTFFPFQFILGLSSARAVLRLVSNNNVWEKTQHSNTHRPGISQTRKLFTHVNI